jgi:hypothetical protein
MWSYLKSRWKLKRRLASFMEQAVAQVHAGNELLNKAVVCLEEHGKLVERLQLENAMLHFVLETAPDKQVAHLMLAAVWEAEYIAQHQPAEFASQIENGNGDHHV